MNDPFHQWFDGMLRQHPVLSPLFTKYFGPLAVYVNRRINNIEDAKEIVYDAFLKCIGLEHVDTTMLHRHVVKSCLVYKHELENEIVTGAVPTEHEAIRNEVMRLICKRVDALPDASKKVFKMFYYDEMTIEEISKFFGMPQDVVLEHKAKAIKLMKLKIFE